MVMMMIPIIITSYSPSHMQTFVKILKFTFLKTQIVFFASLVHYMFGPIWWPSSSAPKTSAENCHYHVTDAEQHMGA
jgi:hypothetical protein